MSDKSREVGAQLWKILNINFGIGTRDIFVCVPHLCSFFDGIV